MTRLWSIILWAVYLSLLAVLLPHTAWAFGQFEPEGLELFGYKFFGLAAAFAFEGAIAALTYRLKQHIESVRTRKFFKRLAQTYLNVYSLGMLIAVVVSAMANWAHAVEFGLPFAVFDKYSVPPLLFALMFGAILPVCSLLFARILANVQHVEEEMNEELAAEKAKRREAEKENRALSGQIRELEDRLRQTEDVARWLFAEDKRQRILSISKQWPELPQRYVALLTDASQGYVSDVLKESVEITDMTGG